MKFKDYTGELNDHKDYLNILNLLSSKCDYIEIVLLDRRKSNELVDKFKNDVLEVKKVKKWWGTELMCSEPCNYLYKIKCTKELFSYLSEFETFCKYYKYGANEKTLEKGEYSEQTDFGIDDIAFYDNNGTVFLLTTTHEGSVYINEDLIQ